MDPISLAVGGVLFAAGFAVGAFTPRRGKDREVRKIDDTTAVCSCGHGLDKHDREKNVCLGMELRDRYVNGRNEGHEYVDCECLRYNGPLPAEEFLSQRYLPPMD